jgi:hypothetical protein
VRERVVVGREGVRVEHTVDGEVRAVRQICPMLVADGLQPSLIELDGRRASVSRGGGRMVFESLGAGSPVRRFGLSAPCRNGFMDAAYAESQGATLVGRLTFTGSRT